MTYCETLKEDKDILRRLGKEVWGEKEQQRRKWHTPQ